MRRSDTLFALPIRVRYALPHVAGQLIDQLVARWRSGRKQNIGVQDGRHHEPKGQPDSNGGIAAGKSVLCRALSHRVLETLEEFIKSGSRRRVVRLRGQQRGHELSVVVEEVVQKLDVVTSQFLEGLTAKAAP